MPHNPQTGIGQAATGERFTADDPFIGAHQSIAGGIHCAVERAVRAGCRALQVFTKNSNQWSARPLTPEDAANYKTRLSESTVSGVIAHDSYLINLCAVNPAILLRSREALVDELQRCELLGIAVLNLHPGSHMGAGESDGISRIVESIDIALDATAASPVSIALETTAGQGSSIGWRFEQLRSIIDRVRKPERLTVCIDTCHIFAAGYDISREEGYRRTMDEFGAILGFGRLAAIHINDSKKGCGSRVDRHEHIGKGMIGAAGFRMLMQDERLIDVPKILETPKGDDLREDIINLRTLRRYAKARPSVRQPAQKRRAV